MAEVVEVKDAVLAELLEDLLHDDEVLTDAEQALRRANARYEIASKRYAATRDVVTRRLGRSPYAVAAWALPAEEYRNAYELKFPSRGKFRFIEMPVGDAAMLVLRGSKDPMNAQAIASILVSGGLRSEWGALIRSVNSALINKPEIEKSEDGYFSIKREELDSIPI